MKHFILLTTLCFSLAASKAQHSPNHVEDTLVTYLNDVIQQDDHILPDPNGRVESVEISQTAITISLALSRKTLNSFSEDDLDEINEHLLPLLPDLGIPNYFVGVTVNNQFVRLEDFLEEEKIILPTPSINQDKPQYFGTRSGGDVAEELPEYYTSLGTANKGTLTNKTVWLSAGHGWLYKNNRWKTQRKNNSGIVEDFGNIEAVNYYLLKYLENAGAKVWTVRERDMNTNEIIVDDESEGFSMRGFWAKSASDGHHKNYRYVYSQGKATAAAVYTPQIPEAGWYWVSTYYRSGANRSKDVRYIINHAGGRSVVAINQETHGLTWVYLGRFYFEKGQAGNVVISNQSNDVNQAIIADAVRFGGGNGTVPDVIGGYSKKPRFEEASLYYTKFQGYPFGVSDVAVRPRYAEWELAKGTWQERNNACYVSWHTNAGAGKGTGTETFIYNGRYTKGSPSLRKFIHQEVVNDIRKEYDPNWRDRGQKSANFGELRNLRTMPGALIEIGFHDHPKDVEALKTPRFRQIAARAVYQGIVRYFAARDNKQPIFLPEPPTHLSAVNVGNSSIKVSWKAPKADGAGGDEATGYKVYVGTHGKAFTKAITVNNTSHTFLNLQANTTYYFKVTATNTGGESFETAVVAARTPKRKQQRVDFLIVDGFDRLDKFAAVKQYDGDYLGLTERHFLERMNSYDYAVYHAQALEKAGYSFDGATNEAIYDKTIPIMKYAAVDWFLGEESTVDQTLNYTERAILKQYLNSGGSLIISGAEHGYELAGKNIDDNFYKNYLKSVYINDDANTYQFAGLDNTGLGNINGLFENGTSSLLYHVDFPDVIQPYGGSETIMRYNGGLGGSAAVAYLGRDFNVINFGFPLEAIPDEHIRNEVIAQAAFMVAKPKYPIVDVVVNYEGNTNKGGIFAEDLPNPANVSPNPFVSKVSIDISDVPSGRASFTLRDSNGNRVKVVKWSHQKGQKKYIKIDTRISKGLYDYEVKVGNRTMRGKVYKKQ